jgi:hypothetical protein
VAQEAAEANLALQRDNADFLLANPWNMNMRLPAGISSRSIGVFALSFALLGVATGCGKKNESPGTRPEPTASRDPYLILADEIEKTSRDNLYDAVRQLRPGWFSRRTRNRTGDETIIVYLDDRQMGSVGSLRAVPVQAVRSVRYLSPTEAQVRYGQINVGRPAILLESNRSP